MMTKENLKKIYIYVAAFFLAAFVAFYFLAGDQIRYRDSRRNFVVTNGNTATEELVVGYEVVQNFSNFVDRLKTITIECTTFYRTNNGDLFVGLYDGNELIARRIFDVCDISEGDSIVFELDDYLENYTGKELTLKISATSSRNHGIALLYDSENPKGNSLTLGKYYGGGTLCFSATGQEYIFTGQHYWEMAGIIYLAILSVLVGSYLKYVKKGWGYIVNAICAIKRYSFLISQLVARDFKTKYKRSVLGVFWSFLNPLLTMTVQYVVFSTLFRNDIKNYAVYLLAGIISYSFFNEVTTMCLQSISGNANLIKKVYIPKYIFPLSRTLSSGINLAISLVPLLLISLITGVTLQKSIILMFYFVVCLIIFSLGVGLLLSALMVFFRDIQFLWSVVVMMWQYATPIFYSPSIIPARFSFILHLNPLYHFIKNIRICIIDGISPEPRAYMYCFVFALISLLFGAFIFKKTQDKFTLYL